MKNTSHNKNCILKWIQFKLLLDLRLQQHRHSDDNKASLKCEPIKRQILNMNTLISYKRNKVKYVLRNCLSNSDIYENRYILSCSIFDVDYKNVHIKLKDFWMWFQVTVWKTSSFARFGKLLNENSISNHYNNSFQTLADTTE